MMRAILSGLLCFVLVSSGLANEYADTLYKQGTAVFESNPAKALELFMLAGEQGSVSAMVGAGHCFETGTGTKIDYAKALEWYEKAAKQNSLKACAGLARIYACCPDPETHDGGKAVRFASAVIRKKPTDSDSLDLLAMAYLRGMRSEDAVRAGNKAVKYAKSIEQANALKTKMVTYEEGRPVPAKATVKWLKEAVEHDVEWAVVKYARMITNPLDEMYNPEWAVSTCERAVSMGHPEFYYEMGMVHFHENRLEKAYESLRSAEKNRNVFSVLPVEVGHYHYLKHKKQYVFKMAGKLETGYQQTSTSMVMETRVEYENGQPYTYQEKVPRTVTLTFPPKPEAALFLYKIAAKKGHPKAAKIVAEKEGSSGS